jgi:hypothetical protein
MPEIILKRNFLDADICQELNAWVMKGIENKWLDVGLSENSFWSYKDRLTTRKYGFRFEYPDLVYEVFDKITNALNLQGVPKSVVGGGKDGVVVSCTFTNGDVCKHTDPMEGSLHVLRCNVMTQSADAGAELFIGGEKIDIGVGDLHCYLPSDVEHYVTKAKGNTPRIMWMFGYQISKQEFLQIKERAEDALAITY